LPRSALLVPCIIMLSAACGRPAATSSVAPTQLPPQEAFRCVMKAFQELGFQRTMYDEEDLRTSARRVNPGITFSNTAWRKTWDRLDVEIEQGQAGIALNILSVTEAEYFSQQGKLLEQIAPSGEVQESARKLESRCSGATPVSPDSVPSANP
jgi:hypothetical protein